MMHDTPTWKIDIRVDEQDRVTRAEARLHSPNATSIVGVGTARCNPHDPLVPKIGDELAMARALADLAHQLLDASAKDIEASTHQPAHLSS